MESHGVINWFTKKMENPSKKPSQIIEEIISEILSKGVRAHSLRSFGDIISNILKENTDMRCVPADTRLPICSLYHHLVNTAGIAVCLGIDNGLSEEELEILRISALLHDIGKLLAFETGDISDHVKYTRDFVQKLIERLGDNIVDKNALEKILRIAPRHHSSIYPYKDMGFYPENKLEHILSIADSIASGTDRTYEVKYDSQQNALISTDKIFPHVFPKFSPPCIIGRCEKKEAKEKEPTKKALYDETVKGYILKRDYPTGTFNDKKLTLFGVDIRGIQNFIGTTKKLHALRGGSYIIKEVQRIAGDIISKKVCREAILFNDGGNLAAFLPSNEELINNIRKEIKEKIQNYTNGALKVAISSIEFSAAEIVDKFGGVPNSCLDQLFDRLEKEKQLTYDRNILEPTRSNEICEYCCDQKGTKRDQIPENPVLCDVCFNKYLTGRVLKNDPYKLDNEIRERWEIYYGKDFRLQPSELEEIGDNIAVVALDGNMIGTMFTQTTTPAEYTFKSETLDKKIKDVLKMTVNEIKEEIKKEKNKKNLFIREYNENGIKKGPFFGFEEIYVGGDDILLIMNAKGALYFTQKFIEKIAEAFKFESEKMTTPIVTLSAGIAIARHDFPIYFLIEKAEQLKNISKKVFRNKVRKNDLNLFERPMGALSLSVVTSSMPSEKDFSFVLPDPDDTSQLELIQDFIEKSQKEEWKPLISMLINIEESDEARLNFVKFLYAQLTKKEVIADLVDTRERNELEVLKKILAGVEKKIKEILEHVIPMVWRD